MSASNNMLFLVSVLKYWRRYFSVRGFPADQEFYTVYTNLDHAIPFSHDSGFSYWLINFRLAPAPVRLGGVLSKSRLSDIRQGYLALVNEGTTAFREAPTIMPHFIGNRRPRPFRSWSLLKPLNCSPSLHTAAPFFIYNLVAEYIPDEEPEFRKYVENIVSTVIGSKYHALMDIAFGMYLCRRVLEDRLNIEFRTLEPFFAEEAIRRDGIPYQHVYRMYGQINELANMGANTKLDFSGLMELYFQEVGLPRVRREKSGCYYDLAGKSLVYTPELSAGKGLL